MPSFFRFFFAQPRDLGIEGLKPEQIIVLMNPPTDTVQHQTETQPISPYATRFTELVEAGVAERKRKSNKRY